MQKPNSFIGSMLLSSLLVFTLVLSVEAQAPDTTSEITMTIEIANRLYPDFHETHNTSMRKRAFVGDTDYSYEVVAFFPRFAIIDSTKEVVSLSDELTNVAFKITVYENEEIVDRTWSFFHVDIPHFAMTSYIIFDVIEFEYQGQTYTKESSKKEPKKEEQ